jgi:hypothetical protein
LWKKIFTQAELADTTTEQWKEVQEFIAAFGKEWPTVEVIKKSWQYRINKSNGKSYFDYFFTTKDKALWNEKRNAVNISNIIDATWEFNQNKWNTELRNMIFQKKLAHPYFTKFDKVNI